MRFGGLKALSDFNLVMAPGELVGLIGPNGAGKTTAFNAITGVYTPTEGDVRVAGERVNGRRPHQICAAASRARSRTSGSSSSSPRSTTCASPATPARRRGFLDCARSSPRPPPHRGGAHPARAPSEYLAVMGLAHRRDELAKNLPYGEQRRLEIARALATEPQGALPRRARRRHERLGEGRRSWSSSARSATSSALAILLIEHDMRLVMGICERLIVLDHGVTIAARDAGASPHATRRSSRRTSATRTSRRRRSQCRPRSQAMSAPVLVVKDLRVHYGAIEALRGVSLEVPEGEVVALIGANGAGKTTTLRAVSRMLRPTQRLRDLPRRGASTQPRAHALVARGMAHAPEGRGIFLNLTVRGEPRARRVPAQRPRRHRRRTLEQLVRALPDPRASGGTGRRARSPAASSRCSPSPARS